MNRTDNFYDALETRSVDERESGLFAALPGQLQHAKNTTKAYAARLSSVTPDSIDSRQALQELPLTRKSDLMELQKSEPPFGGLLSGNLTGLRHVFVSPGPISEPEGNVDDYWRMARALFAAGFRAGDLVHNTFSYHMTPAGFMMESAARALGCITFPAGIGQTEQQIEAIEYFQPNAYTGTPSFLKILLEKADACTVDTGCFTRAMVGGEALAASMRESFQSRGIHTRQCYATADIGLIAYETDAMEGMVVDEHVILEIVRPGTGEAVATGEVGEIVVTTFSREYPLVRFATGDLSAILTGQSPCGRTNTRIKGWMGRADQTTKVKGMFVHPSQVAQIQERIPELTYSRLVIDRIDDMDEMTLHCEIEDGVGVNELAIRDVIREITKLRGSVKAVRVGSLPRDGKVIDDLRRYD